MRRGEIWLGNLNPNRGSEVGKIRPVLIIEADWSVARPGSSVVIVPLTTQVVPESAALRPVLEPRGELRARSQILTEQMRALDRRRMLQGPLAKLEEFEMAAFDRILSEVLGLS